MIAPDLLGMAIPLRSVQRDPSNANGHDAASIQAIRESLEKFGQLKPIVVQRSTMMVVAGNGTHEAAEKAEWEFIAAHIVDLSDAEALQYAIADNATGDLSQWRQDRLAEALTHTGAVPGISQDRLSELLAEAKRRARLAQGETFNPETALVANPDATKVQTGEIWQLGEHRLLCGDSTVQEQVAALFGDERAEMVWTDPPYGVDYEERNAEHNSRPSPCGSHSRNAPALANDDLEGDALTELIRSALSLAGQFARPGACVYVAAPQGENLEHFLAAFRGSGFTYKWQLIWNKGRIAFGRADYCFQHENILYGWKQDAGHYCRKKSQSSVFDHPKPARSSEHGTMKPVELVEFHMENSSHAGRIVYDPFGGSGTTLRAAQRLGRRCFIVEKVPHFASVIVALWEAMTGESAVRVREGEET